MQIGFVGLGKMGGNMVRRLLGRGQAVVAWDPDAATLARIAAEGAVAAAGLADLGKRGEMNYSFYVKLFKHTTDICGVA